MPTFYQRFQESARKFPDNIALEIQRQQTVERVTFAELSRMSESVARWLSTRVPRDARVAILAANHPRWVAAYLGIIAAGRTAVPLDTTFNADQVKKLLIDSGASLLFCDVKHLPVAAEAVEGLGISLVMTSAAAEQNPNPGAPLIASSAMSGFRGTQALAADLDSIFAAGPAGFQPIVPAEDDLAALLYTSGTTADPKGVMLTHANLVGEANSVFAVMKIGPEDALLGILPMFHVLAQMANLFLPLFNGARVVYLETLNTTELLRALQTRDITVFCVVPQFFYLIHERIFKELHKRGKLTLSLVRTLMALNRLLRRVHINAGKLFFGKIHATFGARMRYLITGGSRFDPAVARDFYSFGIDVLNAYGLTETSGGAFINPPGHDVVFGSVGRPFPGVEAKIMEEKTADPQPVEEGAPLVGEIAIRSAIVMKGYWNRPEATAEVLRDGWFYTGDLGYFDSGGNLFITGRRKEIIVLANAKNVYPEEIEAHYLRAQSVKEICVMASEARPGDPTSERLHAVVVPNFELLRERKIVNAKEAIRLDIEALSHKIASSKRLGSYDIWQEDLPRTTTRKLKRFQIEQRVRELKQNDGSGTADVGKEKEKPLTDDEQSWLEREGVKRALAIVGESSREPSRTRLEEIRPTHNLELDLGLDSMQRIELLTALEQQLGGEVPESQLAEIYSVRDLVDAVLASASRGEGQASAEAPAWSTIFSEPDTDPEVLALARHNIFAEVFFFLLGKLIYLFALDRLHLRMRGLENLPEKGPFLLCSNHQSYIDPMVMVGALPWRLFRDTFALGTSDIFGKGFMRRLARWLRVAVLDPDANLVSAMRAGAFGLSQGHILVMYPEGERTNDGNPRVFRKGAAILSIHARAPIVPIAIEGFYEFWPRHKKFPKFADVQLTFGKPIQPSPLNEASEAAYEQLTSELKTRVVAMWQELREKELRENELRGKNSSRPESESKNSALAEATPR
jgi:long-chain acyl-CoA synthetase